MAAAIPFSAQLLLQPSQLSIFMTELREREEGLSSVRSYLSTHSYREPPILPHGRCMLGRKEEPRFKKFVHAEKKKQKAIWRESGI